MMTRPKGYPRGTLVSSLAAVLAITLLALAVLPACQGQAAPTREPNRGPSQTNEALREQLSRLQTAETTASAAALQAATARPPSRTITAVKPTAPPAGRSDPTPPPKAMATVPPLTSSPRANICRRPPRIQAVILNKLQVNLCSAATNEELFRITGLSEISVPETELLQGHFHGLENVKELRVTAGAVGHRAFEGMTSLNRLTLTVRDGHMSSQALAGLPNLTHLELHLQPPRKGNDATKTAGQAAYGHLTRHRAAPWTTSSKLQTLTVTAPRQSLTLSPTAHPLTLLAGLEDLHIENNDGGEYDTPRAMTVPASLLPPGGHLLSLSVKNNTDGATARFPAELLEAHPQLTGLTLSGYWQIPRTALAGLSDLEHLNIHSPNRTTGRSHHLALHEDSPVYKTAVYGNSRPSNVEIVNLPEGQ